VLAVSARGDDRLDLQISQIKNVRMGFFSSIVPERLAHLQFAEAAGAHRQVGPFQIATPGVSLKYARLEINATPCTPTDWTAFTAGLAKYRAAQLRTPGGDPGPPQTVVVGWVANAPQVLQPAGPRSEPAMPASVRVGAPAPIPAPDPVSPL
jgi:hypothetical protein